MELQIYLNDIYGIFDSFDSANHWRGAGLWTWDQCLDHGVGCGNRMGELVRTMLPEPILKLGREGAPEAPHRRPRNRTSCEK